MKSKLLISCVFPPEPTISGQIVRDVAVELAKKEQIAVISPKPTRPFNYTFPSEKQSYDFKHIIAQSYVHPQSGVFGRLKESYSFGKWCKKYIEKNKENIEVVYHNSWPLFAQYFIVKTAKKYNIPCITHVQDIYPDSIANKIPILGKLIYRLFLPMDRYILKNSKKVICISDNMKSILSRTRSLPNNLFTIVQNWQNEEPFIKFHDSNVNESLAVKKPLTFMYLGNNGPVAGVELLIEAFVAANIPSTQLIIAGSGSRTQACKDLVEKLHAKNIQFMSVPDGKVQETQDLATVMLLPVKTGAAMSSIPSKLPAYMFSKKTILGSLDLESDTARAIVDANCGIVVEPENAEKLTLAMKEIAQWDNQKLAQFGENGFDYAIEKFSKKANLEKIIKELTIN